MAFLRAKTRVQWSTQLIEGEKASIRAELDAQNLEGKERLQEALRRVKQTEDDEQPLGRLRCFIYIVTTLVQNQRTPTLTEAQVESLVSRAYAILQTQGIKAGVSRLAFLYGEVHQALSLLYWREGLVWRAAWEQQLGAYVSRPTPVGGEGFQSLALGHRSLRLGNAGMAHWHYQDAENQDLAHALWRHQARIGRIQALRLAGHFQEAADLIKETASLSDRSAGILEELEWETFCLETIVGGDLRPLMRATEKASPFHQGTYVLEAFLWAAASSSKQEWERMPALATLLKRKELKLREAGYVLRACETIAQCYDGAIPIVIRLRKLGNVLGETDRLITVNKELLVLAAAARWLARVHSFPLAALTLRRYQDLSRRLSDGASDDALRLMADLSTSEWVLKYGWPTKT